MESKGKRVIITGGASGIGARAAERLMDEGASVAVFDVAERPLRELSERRTGLHAVVCDVSDAASVERAVDEVWKRFRGIDILINNAGKVHNEVLVRFSKEGIVKHDTDAWDRVIATNLSGVFYMSSSVLRRMVNERLRGLVINVSSIAAAGNIGQSAYSASKAGINALTVTWAKELGAMGIRVAAIAPGFAATETTLRSMTDAMVDEWKRKTPVRRMAEPDEIVEGILFIIRNDFFHGRILELDGGLRI